MEFRALCTDIDGTLLNGDRELSRRTIATIKSIDKNIPVILASSRMPSAMRHLQRELDILQHPLICYNGGYVIQYENDTATPDVIDSVQIPLTVCTSILKLTLGKTIHVSLYYEDNWYAPGLDQWTEREARITKVSPTIENQSAVFEQWRESNNGAHKVMCMGSEEEILELYGNLIDGFSDQLHIYRSKSTYLEIAPRTISKASALKLILNRLYAIDPSEVIAFGDNYNDIELIQSVGLGVAVENARPEVKAIAKKITSDSKNDGVAKVIERYFGR